MLSDGGVHKSVVTKWRGEGILEGAVRVGPQSYVWPTELIPALDRAVSLKAVARAAHALLVHLNNNPLLTQDIEGLPGAVENLETALRVAGEGY